jgi:hypothetical protein
MEMSKKEISKTKETAVWNCTSKRYEIYFVNIFTKMELHKKLSSYFPLL